MNRSGNASELGHLAEWRVEGTSRLSISVLGPADAGTVFEITHDPAITSAVQILENLSNESDVVALLSGHECFFGGWRGWELAGVVYVHEHVSGGLEIGYWIASPYAGMGYATELAGGVIAQIRRSMPGRAIVAECRPENLRSWRVLEKLGFRAAGVRGVRPGRELLRLLSQ